MVNTDSYVVCSLKATRRSWGCPRAFTLFLFPRRPFPSLPFTWIEVIPNFPHSSAFHELRTPAKGWKKGGLYYTNSIKSLVVLFTVQWFCLSEQEKDWPKFWQALKSFDPIPDSRPLFVPMTFSVLSCVSFVGGSTPIWVACCSII